MSTWTQLPPPVAEVAPPPTGTFPAVRVWRLTHKARPWTVNAERRMYHQERAELVREWRHAFKVLAKDQRVPTLARATVSIQPELATKRSWPDCAACANAAKAAIDGLVDAKVLDDDDPTHLVSICFVAPVLGRRNALTLEVREA